MPVELPDGEQMHAFQLVPVDVTSEHAASEALVLAAPTAAEKAEWVKRLTVAFGAMPRSATQDDALETQLAATSIS